MTLSETQLRFHVDSTDPRHGTYNGYSNLKCRCSRCRAANVVKNREMRVNRWAKTEANDGIAPGRRNHGTSITYSNWGCTCPKCLNARDLASLGAPAQFRSGRIRRLITLREAV